MFSVLGIDPNTWTTGVTLVSWNDAGQPSVHIATEFHAKDSGGIGSTLMARGLRMASIWEAMDAFFGGLALREEVASTFVVAYERHTWRGEEASEAISMMTGAILVLPFLVGHDVIPVDPNQAKAAWSCRRWDREDAKRDVVEWARREFRIAIADEQHDIADALAVCVAARGIWREAERERLAEARKAAQRPLFGPGSRGGKRR